MKYRQFFKWRHIAIGAALVIVSAATQANLFVNPGFETGNFSGWANSGGAVTNAAAHSGSFSFAGFSSDNVSQSFSPIATSLISQLSFWGERNGGLFDLVILTYSDSTSQNVLVNTLGQGNGWTFVDLTANLLPGKSLVGFLIYGTTSGPAFLDDFNLATASVVPEPSTYALLALALCAMGFVSRRRRVWLG